MMRKICFGLILTLTLAAPVALAEDGTGDVERLIGALLGDTPMVADLQSLTDDIGGRETGSDANARAVQWALDRFKAAGVSAKAEPFPMPRAWHEESAMVRIEGHTGFAPAVVTRTFSTATPAGGLSAPLVDGGSGAPEDFARLGDRATSAWILFESPILDDAIGLAGLFAEYDETAVIEPRALKAGVAGIIYMSSRPNGLLFMHNATLGADSRHPMLTMEREGAKRALRIIRAGGSLTLTADIRIKGDGAYTADNVIAEIPGSEHPEEIVIFGAHLDSFALGTGALDNGANVTMLMDIARQITRLGLRPRRTIRIALWNGEEQGIMGSLGYTKTHADELDNHIVAASFDIGTGRITGLSTNGMAQLTRPVIEYLRPVAGLGPFAHDNEPLVGTDNLDFMLEGVPNLVGLQADANYASNYHAASDTFDKADLSQLRLNAAVVAALLWGFANDETRLPRQTRGEVEALVANTSLGNQLKSFGIWDDWASGVRGRQ